MGDIIVFGLGILRLVSKRPGDIARTSFGRECMRARVFACAHVRGCCRTPQEPLPVAVVNPFTLCHLLRL